MTVRCLVTGATGFIGSHLARRLVGEGYGVRALARPTADTSKLEGLGVEIVPGDLTDFSSVSRAADGATHVFHCGAMVSDWATVREIRQVNVGGTRHVLQAALDARVTRLIQVSSTDVYGHPGLRGVDEEFVPTRFSNWYSRTKLEAESEVHRAAAAGRLETVILRPATVYGPGSVNVVGEIAKAIRAGNMLLIDHGRAEAGLCYVESLVDAAARALSEPAAAGETFNVVDGDEITWQRFVDDLADRLGARRPRLSLPYRIAQGLGFAMEQSYRLLRRATGLHAPPLLSRQAVDVMGRDQSFSNARLSRRLGWAPRVDYETGLGATVAWLSTWLDAG